MDIIEEKDVDLEEVKVEIVVEALDPKTETNTIKPEIDYVDDEAQVQELA